MKINFERQVDILFVGQLWDPEKKDIRLFVQEEDNVYDVTEEVAKVADYTPLRKELAGVVSRGDGRFIPEALYLLFRADPMAEAFRHAHNMGYSTLALLKERGVKKDKTPYELFSEALEMQGRKNPVSYAEIDVKPDIKKSHLISPIRVPSKGIGVTYAHSQQARSQAISGDNVTDPYAFARQSALNNYRVEAFSKAEEPWHFVPPNGNIGLSNDFLRDGETPVLSAIEPEVGGVLNPYDGVIEAFALANDGSRNLLEKENLLWLHQAKCFNACFAIGPTLMLVKEPTNAVPSIEVAANIERNNIERNENVSISYRFNTNQIVMDNYDVITRTLTSNDILPYPVFVSFGAGAVPSNDGPDRTYQQGDKWSIWTPNNPLYVLKGGVAEIPKKGPNLYINPNYEKAMLERIVGQ